MGLSLTEKAGLKLRGLPVGRIEKAMAMAEEAGIAVNVADFSAHLLCRGSIEKVVEALVLAKREGVPASWSELCALDLAGSGGNFNILTVVRDSAQVRESIFTTFADDLKEPICGICRDGSRVSAECKVSYRLPLSHVFGSRMDFLQERLATRIGAYIFDAVSAVRLQMSRSEHEASLLVLAQKIMPTLAKLELRYSTGP